MAAPALAPLARFARMLRRRKVYLATLRELNALTSRELADLGIPRSMITRHALEAARAVD
jgi:uncharacterized protein YjiS (DUF1127 family)